MAKKAVEEVNTDLELEEKIKLHNTGWKVQRIGWGIIFLIPILGAFGLFGEGMLSQRKEAKGAIEAQFERFYCYEKEMKIQVASTEHMPQLSLPQQYLKNFRVVRIIPEPEHRLAVAGNIVYHFGGTDNREVAIYAVPQTYGRISGQLSVNNQMLFINHFIFP